MLDLPPSFLPFLSLVCIAAHRKVAKKDKELGTQRNGVLSCLDASLSSRSIHLKMNY